MTFRLRFPTLFDALPSPAPAARTLPGGGTAIEHWRARRAVAAVAGLGVGLAALAGCDRPPPHALLDAEAAPVRPASEAPATVHDTVNPASGALRLPSALQGYGT